MTYDEQHAAIITDLKGKLERGDWHGVSDAANDLRVLEAQGGNYETLRRTKPPTEMCPAFYKSTYKPHGKHRCQLSYGHNGPCLFD